jgi:hypothetical protein
MKKALWLALVFSLAVIMLAGCGEVVDDVIPDPDNDVPIDEDPEVGEITQLGMGVVTSIARSLDYNEEQDILPMAQVDNVIAVAAFDSEGRIVDVLIDTAQTRVNFDEELQVTSDLAAEIRSKKELGDDYGMRAASEIGREWDEQITDLEAWMAGKTVDEIMALPLEEGGYPDDPDLATAVTMTVAVYFEAVEKAYANAVAVEPGATSLGLGHNIAINRSTGYSMVDDTEILPLAQVDVIIAGAVFTDAGEVAGVQIDAAQTRVRFDEDGQVTSDRAAAYLTKKELGDDYGMRAASPIGREWDEQIADLEEWMVGKTVDEITALDLLETGAPDDPDLLTSVTITATYYLEALEEAYNRAR